MGVAAKGGAGGFTGVWAAEFTLDSVGDFLLQLKDGFHGAIYVASADATGFQGVLALRMFSQLSCARHRWLPVCGVW